MPPEILTVTVSPSIGQTAWIPGFVTGSANLARRAHSEPTGAGLSVASTLAALGHRVTATGLIGAADAPDLDPLLGGQGIDDAFIRTRARTRSRVIVVDEFADETTTIDLPGAPPDDDDLDRLATMVADQADGAAWVVLGGPLPAGTAPGLYARLIEVAHRAGARVALDTTGSALEAGITAGPDLLKPGHAELEALVGRFLPGGTSQVAAMRSLQAQGIDRVAVSLGNLGALFADAATAVFAAPLAVPVVTSQGAGDAMMAGLIAADQRHLSLRETAAFATATATTALCQVPAADVARWIDTLAPTVELNVLPDADR